MGRESLAAFLHYLSVEQKNTRRSVVREGIATLVLGNDETIDAMQRGMPPDVSLTLTRVKHYRDLSDLPHSHPAEFAILCLSFPAHELARSAEFIRRHWPKARILLIGWPADALDDPLYDERLQANATPDAMLTAFVRMTTGSSHHALTRATEGA